MTALTQTAAPAAPENALRPVVITVVALKLVVSAFLLVSVSLSSPIANNYDTHYDLASR